MWSGRLVFGLIAVTVFALDRITKRLVEAQIPFGSEIPVIGHVVGITNVRNSGAAFGLVPAAASLFLVASIVVSIGLIVYVARNPGRIWTDAALGLVLGGTLGNGYDRIIHGTVTDFVNFHFWPVFNVADTSISLGVLALVVGNLLRKPPA